MSTNYPSTSTDLQPIPAKNGALRDPITGQFVPGGNVSTAIATPSQGLAMQQRREELKHQAIQEAANLAARAEMKNSRHPEIRALVDNDLAYMQAIAIGRTQAAMDADSPYGNAAAAWITDNTGHAEVKQQAQPQTVQHVHSLDAGQAAQIAALLADMGSASGQLIGIISNDDIVDAQAQDIAQDTDAHTQHTLEAGTGADDAAE